MTGVSHVWWKSSHGYNLKLKFETSTWLETPTGLKTSTWLETSAWLETSTNKGGSRRPEKSRKWESFFLRMSFCVCIL